MKVCFVVPSFFAKGRIFDEYDPVANRDDCLRPFIELQRTLRYQGVILATEDQVPMEAADAVLCLNMPKASSVMWEIVARRGVPVHVIALESVYIHAPNGDPDLIARCKSIFTSRDDIIDGIKFFPIRFAQQLTPSYRRSWADRKFACMVSGNKASSHPDELYSQRLDVIHWYDRHHSKLFHLFGAGWNTPTPSNLFMRAARRLPFIPSLLAPKLKVYRGTIEQKLDTLADYRFCFCYENFSSPDGWITEKIFDAMFAGCVPVYWGPNNIEYHIPSACYIDASKLSEPQAIHELLVSFDDRQCAAVVDAIDDYLRSEQAAEFSIATFVKTIGKRLHA